MTFSHSQSSSLEIHECFCTWTSSSAAFSFAQPFYCVSVPNFCSVWSVKGTHHWLSSFLLGAAPGQAGALTPASLGIKCQNSSLWAPALPVVSSWLPSLLPHKMYLEFSVFLLSRKKKKKNPFCTRTRGVLGRRQPVCACTSGHCSGDWLWFVFQVVVHPCE